MILIQTGAVTISGSSPVVALLGSLDGRQPTTIYLQNSGDGDIGAVLVEHSSYGPPSYPGPWVESPAAEVTFSNLQAGESAAFVIDAPVESVRLTVTPGPYSTTVKVTAVI